MLAGVYYACVPPECLRVAGKNTRSFQSEALEGLSQLALAGSYSSAHPQLFLAFLQPFSSPLHTSPLPQPGQHHSFHFIRFSRPFVYFAFPFRFPLPSSTISLLISSLSLAYLPPCLLFPRLTSVSRQFAPLIYVFIILLSVPTLHLLFIFPSFRLLAFPSQVPHFPLPLFP